MEAVRVEIAVMGQEIQEVKAALGGTGVYLGITDRDQLFSELQLLRKKEVQLREEMLGLLRLKPAVAKEIGPDEDGEDAAVAASKRASPPAQPVASARCGGGALPPPTIRPVGKTSQQVSEQCMKRAAGLLEQGGSSTGSEEVPALDSGCSAGKRRKAIKIPEAEPAADKHAPASCAQELLVPILIPKKEWPVAASAGDFGATEATPLPNERAPEHEETPCDPSIATQIVDKPIENEALRKHCERTNLQRGVGSGAGCAPPEGHAHDGACDGAQARADKPTDIGDRLGVSDEGGSIHGIQTSGHGGAPRSSDNGYAPGVAATYAFGARPLCPSITPHGRQGVGSSFKPFTVDGRDPFGLGGNQQRGASGGVAGSCANNGGAEAGFRNHVFFPQGGLLQRHYGVPPGNHSYGVGASSLASSHNTPQHGGLFAWNRSNHMGMHSAWGLGRLGGGAGGGVALAPAIPLMHASVTRNGGSAGAGGGGFGIEASGGKDPEVDGDLSTFLKKYGRYMRCNTRTVGKLRDVLGAWKPVIERPGQQRSKTTILNDSGICYSTFRGWENDIIRFEGLGDELSIANAIKLRPRSKKGELSNKEV